MRFPSYTERFYSALPPAEVLRRLQTSLLPADAPTWRDDYQPASTQWFEGSITGCTFWLLRYFRHPGQRHTAPLPIEGSVSAREDGSAIQLRYVMLPDSGPLLSVQMALVSALLACVGIGAWYSTRTFPWFVVVALGLFFTWTLLMTYVSFRREAAWSRPILTELLGLAWDLSSSHK